MQLQWLNLAHTKATGAGLENIKGLTRLQQLDLRGVKAIDAGLTASRA